MTLDTERDLIPTTERMRTSRTNYIQEEEEEDEGFKFDNF